MDHLPVQPNQRPAAAHGAPGTLRATLDAGGGALAVFDADGGLTEVSEDLPLLLPELAGRLSPGVSFAELLRCLLDQNPQASHIPSREAWIGRRQARWRRPRGRFAFRTAAGAWLLANERRLPDGGKLFLLTDIARRRRSAERLRASRAAVRDAERTKNEFLAQMNHDFHTPLNAIIGFSEILASEAFGPLGSARYRAYARDIHDSGLHLLSLVANLLDLTRVQSGERHLAEQAMALDDVVTEVVAGLAEYAGAEGVAITTDVAAGLPLLLGDPDAVRQMLTHLLANAIRFTPRQGHAVVSASAMPDGGLALMVADTGPGIPAEEIGLVLEPFARVHGSTARPTAKGVGIGLPLTKRLMDLHDGRLELLSEAGAGTTAILLFPPERAIPREAVPPVPLPPVRLGRSGRRRPRKAAWQTPP